MEIFFEAAPLNFCFSLFRWTGSGQFKQPSGSILWMAPEGMTSFFRLGFDVEVGRFRNFLMAFSTMDSEVTVYFLPSDVEPKKNFRLRRHGAANPNCNSDSGKFYTIS